MADIAHVLPASLVPNPNTSIGMVRPGMSSVNYKTGRTLSRDFGSHHLKTYTISPKIFASDSTLLNEFEAFWNNINGGEDEAYILEPYSHVHRMVPCGPITDGTRTCFPANIVGASSETVFVDGVPIGSDDYTLHSVANLLSDAYAVGTGWVAEDGVDLWDTLTGFSLVGLSSRSVVPLSDGTPSILKSGYTSLPAAAEGDIYSVIVGVYETKSAPRSFSAGIRWLTSANVTVAASAATEAAAVYGAWKLFTHTATAPATTAKAQPFLQEETNIVTDMFYLDAFAICPATYDRWHLPSQAPSVIEFDTAPAAGSRVYISATGKRLTRCAFELDASWTAGQNDNLTMKAIRATEVLEY